MGITRFSAAHSIHFAVILCLRLVHSTSKPRSTPHSYKKKQFEIQANAHPSHTPNEFQSFFCFDIIQFSANRSRARGEATHLFCSLAWSTQQPNVYTMAPRMQNARTDSSVRKSFFLPPPPVKFIFDRFFGRFKSSEESLF